ncbi:MAG TPA: TROVE domain-containing protein [Gaiellales bacterium]|nr:TROVE domain-containing protein [Gaiellales bacterium]
MSYLTRLITTPARQRERLQADQIRNSEGGYVFEADMWTRLRRFLILGSEGGSFYAGERDLTREATEALDACIAADGERVVSEIVAVSRAGRAPKNDPAIYALARCAAAADQATRRAALDVLPLVCRTATHLFMFVTIVRAWRGWGRALRRAVGSWYAAQPVERIAYQAVKYRQRDGVTHRDVLRLAHPGAAVSAGNPTLDVTSEQAHLFEWIVRGGTTPGLPRIVEGFTRVQAAASPAEAAELVREFDLPREAVNPEHLTSPLVWEALLERMPLTAMIRNLATMTRVGLIGPGSDAAAVVAERLASGEQLTKARVHPIALLIAQRTYASGRGLRGSGTWTPVTRIVDALDDAFYRAFGNVTPAGQRLMLALDVSGSMAGSVIAGVPGLSAREASAAMALVTLASERDAEVVGFHSGRGSWIARKQGRFPGRADGLAPLPLSPRQRLADAVRSVSDLPFGGTDCALPMLYATTKGRAIDTFVIYTDSETWAGDIHPVEALRRYRRATGIPARLIVCAMVANRFTIADPTDAGMLDVVGFDTSTPEVIGGFARGDL